MNLELIASQIFYVFSVAWLILSVLVGLIYWLFKAGKWDIPMEGDDG